MDVDGCTLICGVWGIDAYSMGAAGGMMTMGNDASAGNDRLEEEEEAKLGQGHHHLEPIGADIESIHSPSQPITAHHSPLPIFSTSPAPHQS